MALSWSLVLLWMLFIFAGSATSGPDEPLSKPVAQPLIEPLVEPINERRAEPLPGPGYDKLDHMGEYGGLGALLWLALAMTARQAGAPAWLARWEWRPFVAKGTRKRAVARAGCSEAVSWGGSASAWARWLPPLVLLAALVASLYGATDELHQALGTERQADWRDWVADSLGGLLGAWLAAALLPRVGHCYLDHRSAPAPPDSDQGPPT